MLYHKFDSLYVKRYLSKQIQNVGNNTLRVNKIEPWNP